MADSKSITTSSIAELGMGSEEGKTSELEQVSQVSVPTLRGRSYTDSEEVRMGERRYCRIQELELDKALESAHRIAGFLDSVRTPPFTQYFIQR
ncbi:hypothetical protein BDN70DRAFT_687219 [Pholiota conissans]|uniref:Uncharacterized protein n=1 Tax=Pholiota conissans TaxID=109636 RepID=A0A9P5YMY3_9AGAR|nr:hypothetical protein BDN70DRAFT_687219 [Pholiota conissans]